MHIFFFCFFGCPISFTVHIYLQIFKLNLLIRTYIVYKLFGIQTNPLKLQK